jgi:3-deoxy-7-phosphoheptulonate synthase
MDIIVLKPGAKRDEIERVVKRLKNWSLKAHISRGSQRTIIGVIGDTSKITEDEENSVRAIEGVEDVMRILKPFKLASREFRKKASVINVRGKRIGGKKIAVIAGPCSVEGRDMLLGIAGKISRAGASFIRGGAFKPRTSPYSFQGLGEEGLKYLAEAREKTGLPVVSELMDPRDMEVLEKYADIIQIGARNMQNFRLLMEVGMSNKPVLLKRGLAATIKDWLMAAEYVMSKGNLKVILCERGIRTFETATRNTLDISAIPVLREMTHLPIVIDPSHGVGRWSLVASMSRAAVAAGADGLMIEVHNRPDEAFSDGEQSLKPEVFKKLMAGLKPVAKAVGRDI